MAMFPSFKRADIITALQEQVKTGEVHTEDSVTEEKSTSSRLSDPKTNEEAIALVEAKTTADVQAVLKVAREFHLTVVPQSGGTSLVAGSEGLHNSIILSTDKMDKIIEINKEDAIAVVEPGVVNGDLDQLARKEGLFYAPDPGSKPISRIGGNVATNAGGMSGVKYGATRDNVLGLKVVLADGREVSVGGRTYKQSYGYDLTHLFIGSEGTLGIVTEITVKLMPIPIGESLVGVAFFEEMSDLAKAVHGIRMSGVYPTRLEAEDKKTIAATDKYEGTNFGGANGGAMLLFEIDMVTEQTEKIVNEVLDKHHAFNVSIETDPDKQNDLRKLRNDMYAAVGQGKSLLTEDMVVPLSKLGEMIDYVGQLGEELNLDIYVAGHAGDGNVHPIIGWPAGEEMPEAATEAVTRMFEKTIELGGMISGEHGVGMSKSGWNHAQLGSDTDLLQHQIKSLLDPMNLLNPKRKID
ncbi:MAG: FAD-linked oxidase C-terminal domain-containing protein [Aerococcus sp.]|nr:FAD-linked oxidase C-terminal domain-containing protein [Aerococcus sp.]